ncbi:MAG: undecaprenyldiphospho-muramoylpentapeptide beta-N-acetylglucosaminyltransferase [Pseudomonadota bacterium]
MRAPIMIMAGGTGGHIYPALAIARVLADRAQPVIWLGTPTGMESRVVPPAGFDMAWVNIAGLRGRGVLGWLLAPFRLTRAVWQALRAIREHAPRLVIGMGGFVSGPGGLAARIAGVPLVVHEQNAVAGMTNRWLARFADKVLQAFDDAFPANVAAETIGNPVRSDIRGLAEPAVRWQDRSGPLRLLVVGGSQGALVLNQQLPAALAQMPESDRPIVRHQAGSNTLEVAQDGYAQAGVRAEVTAFIDDMSEALGWADLVISRAGALTISELCNVGLPAVLVPFPLAVDDHQTANAQAMVNAGAALIVQQSVLTPESLLEALATLGRARDSLLVRAEKARALRSHDAVAAVLTHCAELLDDTSLLGATS